VSLRKVGFRQVLLKQGVALRDDLEEKACSWGKSIRGSRLNPEGSREKKPESRNQTTLHAMRPARRVRAEKRGNVTCDWEPSVERALSVHVKLWGNHLRGKVLSGSDHRKPDQTRGGDIVRGGCLTM